MFNAIHFYRIARWLYLHHIPFLPKFFQLLIFLFYNSNISYKCDIGKKTKFSHGGIGILFNDKVKIGENCGIGANVSIVGQTPHINVPVLKDDIRISPGAVIQGPVIIESHVMIGANAVVNKSVPEYAIVAGIPARIIGDVRNLDYKRTTKAFKEGWKDYLTTNDDKQKHH